MISSLCWIPRGAAKALPDRYEPSEDDIEKWKAEIGEEEFERRTRHFHAPHVEKSEDGVSSSSAPTQNSDSDPFRMNSYDDEVDLTADDLLRLNFGNMYFESNTDDPYLENPDTDSEEEVEDFAIDPDDLLVLATKFEEDISRLELYVYEEKEQNIFVHHDLLLSSMPLSVAWLGYDISQTSASGVGNFVAVGTFKPEIEIWNLDVIDSPEPVCVLGGLVDPDSLSEDKLNATSSSSSANKKKSKKNRKAKKQEPSYRPGSHTDAVSSLSWNTSFRNLLASGSADSLVKVWDLESRSCVVSVDNHSDKVAAVQWNISQPNVLLSGGFDRNAFVFDPEQPTSALHFSISSDVEDLAWNPFVDSQFAVSTEDGSVFFFDVRMPNRKLFMIQAHSNACSTISFSPAVSGYFATGSNDGFVKLWDISDSGATSLYSRDMDIGPVFSIGFCPNSPFTLAIGGARGALVLWNSLEISSLRDRYSDSCTPELLQLVGRDKKPVLHIRTDVEGDESDVSDSDDEGEDQDEDS